MIPSLKKLYEEQKVLSKKIKNIKKQCKHPEKDCQYVNRGDTGNWCPSDDSYWTNHYCARCDTQWITDGSNSYGKKVDKIDRNIV